MAGLAGVLFITIVVTLASADQRSGFLAGPSQMSAEQVEQQFLNELGTLLGHGDAVSIARLGQLEEQLRPLYAALPKGEGGSLNYGAARYALHRFFVQQHGWYVQGLEAAGSEKWGDSASTAMLVDHIPGYVLQLFEQHRGGQTDLRELAVLAATLEDLVHSEAIQKLSAAYDAQGLSVESGLDDDAVERVIATYLLFHIMPNPKYAKLNTQKLNLVLQRVEKFYTGWTDTLMWLKDLEGTIEHEDTSRKNPFMLGSARAIDFRTIARLVERMGQNYGRFQNLECHSLKTKLLDLSDGHGRVRLSQFYQAAFENKTVDAMHFSESPDYLRHLGLLDETDPQQPKVILTNYYNGRGNCLASSGLYSICCIDECEALMATLERNVASPWSNPSQIVGLVSDMSSDTVSAPRNLSATMLRRLDEIAARHRGSIPLHGRLFAQWMHHAFPNECPYPHATGTLAAPLTPSEWIHSGPVPGERRALKASKDEMQMFVQGASDLNATEALFEEQEMSNLPWTEQEELFAVSEQTKKVNSWLRIPGLCFLMFSAASALRQAYLTAHSAFGAIRNVKVDAFAV